MGCPHLADTQQGDHTKRNPNHPEHHPPRFAFLVAFPFNLLKASFIGRRCWDRDCRHFGRQYAPARPNLAKIPVTYMDSADGLTEPA
jgi:hypothetical protein